MEVSSGRVFRVLRDKLICGRAKLLNPSSDGLFTFYILSLRFNEINVICASWNLAKEGGVSRKEDAVNNSYPKKACPCGRHCLNHGPTWETKKDQGSATKLGRDLQLVIAILLIGFLALLQPISRLNKADSRLILDSKVLRGLERDCDDLQNRVWHADKMSSDAHNDADTRRHYVRKRNDLTEQYREVAHKLVSAEESVKRSEAAFGKYLRELMLYSVAVLLLSIVPCFTRVLGGYTLCHWHCRRPMRVLVTKTYYSATDCCTQCGRERKRKWTVVNRRRYCLCCGYSK
jgi:hypothetical protein